ncbi:MAG: AhpC/TSA family protein [Bacteroidaceae bacterium]|nr:AhpC/TSA family protein [Bacteroidaceae bacterium]
MKKLLFLLAITATLTCCSNKSNYTLSGTFDDFNGQTVWLISSNEPIDSVQTSDGSFMFTGKASVPSIAYVADARSAREAKQRCMFFLEPGTLTMEKNSDEGTQYVVHGTKSNDLLAGYDAIEDELEEYYKQNQDKEGIDDEIEKRYNEILSKQVKDNLDNMYGLYCLSDLSYMQSPELTRALLSTFSKEMCKTKLWNTIDERNIKMLATTPGKQYMEFSQTDANGIIISSKDVLADPANKYVLIDFWASWCGPCMREVPYLTETYAKYKDKGFQILGVSLDRTRDAWLAAIERNGMNWIHVSDLKYWENEVARQYGVNSIPANFLVDCSNGQIIATGLRGNKLEQKIAELLD